MTVSNANPSAEVRVDVWLWAARFFKTRGLAKEAIGGGKVELNGAHCKAARALRVGDRLAIRRGDEAMEVAVLGLSDRRGPAPAAQQLYCETEASRLAREAARAQRRLIGAPPRPAGRPDKHGRAALRRLKDGNGKI